MKKIGEIRRARDTPSIVFARVRNALKRKGVAPFPKGEAVCAKCAQAEENTGFVFCGVKRGIAAVEKRPTTGKVRSNSSNGDRLHSSV